MSKEASKAHAVLHYIISKAVLEGKEMKSEIALSLFDLMREFEDAEYEVETITNAILRIKIQTVWDTSNELIPVEQFIGEDEDEQLDTDPSSDKDKGSH